MSVEKVHEALSKIQEHEDSDFYGPQSESLINEAERILGVFFPDDYKEFVRTCGAGSFRGLEIYGLIGSVNGKSIPNIVWYTLSCRGEGMPSDLLPIDFSEVGSPCIRVKKGSLEFPVVAYFDHYPIDAQVYEVLASSFGDFLLNEVEERLTWEG